MPGKKKKQRETSLFRKRQPHLKNPNCFSEHSKLAVNAILWLFQGENVGGADCKNRKNSQIEK